MRTAAAPVVGPRRRQHEHRGGDYAPGRRGVPRADLAWPQRTAHRTLADAAALPIVPLSLSAVFPQKFPSGLADTDRTLNRMPAVKPNDPNTPTPPLKWIRLRDAASRLGYPSTKLLAAEVAAHRVPIRSARLGARGVAHVAEPDVAAWAAALATGCAR